jgi:hypothetical protein
VVSEIARKIEVACCQKALNCFASAMIKATTFYSTPSLKDTRPDSTLVFGSTFYFVHLPKYNSLDQNKNIGEICRGTDAEINVFMTNISICPPLIYHQRNAMKHSNKNLQDKDSLYMRCQF